MQKYYAGIGSRSTPATVLRLMQKLAGQLETENWVLRSGGADGADTAFESGVKDSNNKQIFLPCKFFNSRCDKDRGMVDCSKLPSWLDLLDTVDRFHPASDRLTDFARSLMARNAAQVLGPDLNSPSAFILAFTPDGRVTGGTGQALRIAQAYNIPVLNLGNTATLVSLARWIENPHHSFNDLLQNG